MRRRLPGIDSDLASAVARVSALRDRCPNPKPDVCGERFHRLEGELDHLCGARDEGAARLAIDGWESATRKILERYLIGSLPHPRQVRITNRAVRDYARIAPETGGDLDVARATLRRLVLSQGEVRREPPSWVRRMADVATAWVVVGDDFCLALESPRGRNGQVPHVATALLARSHRTSRANGAQPMERVQPMEARARG